MKSLDTFKDTLI